MNAKSLASPCGSQAQHQSELRAALTAPHLGFRPSESLQAALEDQHPARGAPGDIRGALGQILASRDGHDGGQRVQDVPEAALKLL